MDEHALRELIADVKAGRHEPPPLRPDHGRPRPHRAAGRPDARPRPAWPRPSPRPRIRAGQARRRRAAQDALVAGAHPAQPALRRRAPRPDGSRIFYEPLAAFDPDGNLVPVLAAEVPSVAERRRAPGRQVGDVAAQEGRAWHDGKPFTADDVIFNWEYAADPATAARDLGGVPGDLAGRGDRQPHGAVSLRQARAVLVRRLLRQPRHDPPEARLRGVQGREVARGARQPQAGRHRARTATWTSSPATRPGELNPGYHVPNRPFFDTLEMKGGGDAVSAARAVLQTGEYDWAWNMQVEDDILQAPRAGRQGPGRDRALGRRRAHPAATSPIPGARSTASARA